MKTHAFLLLVAQTRAQERPFEAKHIDPYQIWDLPVYILNGIRAPKETVNDYDLAELLTHKENLYEKILFDLHRYGKYVDPNNPKDFLKTLVQGSYPSKEDTEPLKLFKEESRHEEIIAELGFNEYDITKHLYLGRNVLSIPKTFSSFFVGTTTNPKLRFIKSYIKHLAVASDYKPEQIAAMLTAGGYDLKNL